MPGFKLNGEMLGLEDLIAITRGQAKVQLTEEAIQKVHRARELVDRYVREDRVEYGITTGFGEFSKVIISKDDATQLQHNLIVSHACGVGNPLPEDVVRGIMALRVNALSRGYSGIRLSTIETLIQMLNRGVHPIIPEKGSLGSSGDLAPLAHMVLVMLGEGEAFYQGERMAGAKAMQEAGIETIELTSKEGLALINGTQVMTSIGAHALYDAINLFKTSTISLGLTMEGLNGITDAFEPMTHVIRRQLGQQKAAALTLNVLEGSQMTSRQNEIRVQDAYSLRCAPHVHGASHDCLSFVREKVELEMNAVTDNPIILVDEDRVISGGNFHGEPMAQIFDYMKIGIAELANISERRIERMVNPALNGHLPAFLIEKGGLNSGFMIVQYSAAALVSENKVLAHPASVDSIPSSANQEDHVSMGTIAARQAAEILYNARRVVAMELLCACQAIDLRGKKQLGKGSEVAYEKIRGVVDFYDQDRVMNTDIEAVVALVESGELYEAVEAVTGKLF
ncbi:MAG: histidine ammonia-lyase [Tissierellia bacterium]|nr:histidine ammonia-lyase [Tissierellia bacterium]